MTINKSFFFRFVPAMSSSISSRGLTSLHPNNIATLNVSGNSDIIPNPMSFCSVCKGWKTKNDFVAISIFSCDFDCELRFQTRKRKPKTDSRFKDAVTD